MEQELKHSLVKEGKCREGICTLDRNPVGPGITLVLAGSHGDREGHVLGFTAMGEYEEAKQRPRVFHH